MGILIFNALFGWVCFAKGVSPEMADFLRATSRYHKSAIVEMNVKKTVKSDLLDKETLYIGKMYLASGRFRWEGSEPEKNLLVYDGKWIWNVQYPSEDFPGPIQVAKGEVTKKNRQQILLLSLVDPKSLKKLFAVDKQDSKNGVKAFKLIPKEKLFNLDQLMVTTSGEHIESLSYVDEVGNLTTMSFSDIKFGKKSKGSLFKYSPEKGAQVSHL